MWKDMERPSITVKQYYSISICCYVSLDLFCSQWSLLTLQRCSKRERPVSQTSLQQHGPGSLRSWLLQANEQNYLLIELNLREDRWTHDGWVEHSHGNLPLQPWMSQMCSLDINKSEVAIELWSVYSITESHFSIPATQRTFCAELETPRSGCEEHWDPERVWQVPVQGWKVMDEDLQKLSEPSIFQAWLCLKLGKPW